MDPGRPPGVFNDEPYAFIKNTLTELETIHQNRQRAELKVTRKLKHPGDLHRGAVWHRRVEVVQSTTSFLQRLLNLFTTEGRKQRRQEQEAAALFRSQVWELLQTNEAPDSLKKRIIKDVGNGVLPFLKESECKTILSSKDTILCSTKEREIIREAAGFLKTELSGLLSRLPGVTLEDSREVLKAYYQLIILSPELLPEGHKAHEAICKLEKHFRDTRQSNGFTDLKITITRSILHNIWEILSPEEYQQLTKRIGNIHTYPYSQRHQALQNVMDLIFDNGLRGSVQGHPRQLVSVNDLAMIKDCYSGLSLVSSRFILEEKLRADALRVAIRINQLPSELRPLIWPVLKKTFSSMSPYGALCPRKIRVKTRNLQN